MGRRGLISVVDVVAATDGQGFPLINPHLLPSPPTTERGRGLPRSGAEEVRWGAFRSCARELSG
jgi:hypothetical protein